MPGDISTWKSLRSSRQSSFKGYLSQCDFKRSLSGIQVIGKQLENGPRQGDRRQSWKERAGQKMKKRRSQCSGPSNAGTETISLFPGWAVRRYRKSKNKKPEDPFEVVIFISGYASSRRELASRSQRAVIRLAKWFASLPKPVPEDNPSQSNSSPSIFLSPSTEEPLETIQFPPRPTKITEDYEMQALENQFQRINARAQSSADTEFIMSSSSVDVEADPPSPYSSGDTNATKTVVPDLRKLHTNLESRLHPFWSTALPSRTIRIHLFACPREATPSEASHQKEDRDDDRRALVHGPIASQDVTTAADGSFQALFAVNWENMRNMSQHPAALHIAFRDPSEEHNILVVTELLPPSSPGSPMNLESEQEYGLKSNPPASQIPSPIMSTALRISVTHASVRVISDIDDTIKLSHIVKGARTVFRNVFVKECHEIIIPGMGEWYTSMWTRGVRFHYVSNGPFELLPVLNEFFQVSQIPPGSLKLKSYSGRSLFNELLLAPAARKRAGVLDILNSFPDSQFLLIGDTGEQDLELYSELARDKPDQVAGIFIRDVEHNAAPIDDPTGSKNLGTPGSRKYSFTLFTTSAPTPQRSVPVTPTDLSPWIPPSPNPTHEPENGPSYFPPSHWSAEPEEMYPTDTSDAYTPTPAMSVNRTKKSSISFSDLGISDSEKKRRELQIRVYKARARIPGHVPLRIFRSAEDCVEVEDILKKQGI